MIDALRNALRTVIRKPAPNGIIVITLALGVGANTAILTVVRAVLWDQLPFQDPQRLVSIWSKRSDRDKAPLSIADCEDFRNEGVLSDIAEFAVWDANLTGEAEPERLQGLKSASNVFQLLGVNAALGRTLEPEDDRPGSRRVAVLSYGLWQRRFGGMPGVVGKTILLNGTPFTVVGILPRTFFFPNPSLARSSFPVIRDVDFVAPLLAGEDPRRADRGDHFLSAVGRLKPGVAAQAAEQRLNVVAQRLQRMFPTTNNKNTGVRLVPIDEELIGNFRSVLFLITIAAALLLVMTSSSLTNLSLTLVSGRSYEFAIRTSLGATRSDLVRQLISEGVLKALAGAAAAMGVAYGGVALLAALAPAGVPRIANVRIDGASLCLDLLLALAVGLMIGIIPAVRMSPDGPASGLRSGSRGMPDRANAGLRSFLSAAQVASSVVLLITAGLLLRSFVKLQSVDPGFDPSSVLVTRLALMPATFPAPSSVAVFHDQLQARMKELPGVDSVGAISILPMSGSLARTDFVIRGNPPASPENTPSANFRVVGPGYFNAMRIPVLSGRDFEASDSGRTRSVAIVNTGLARRFFPRSNPIGEHLHIEFGAGEVEIAGVVADVRQVGPTDEPGQDIYIPYAQAPAGALALLRNNMYWVVRSSKDPAGLSTAIRRAVFDLSKDVAVVNTKTLDQYLSAVVGPRRFNLVLLEAFAASAMLLAVLALYGVVSYTVARRTREIGVRMALGAQRRDVLVLILSKGLLITVSGLAVGLAGAAACAHFVQAMLYQTEPLDRATFSVVAGLLLAAGLAASYVPARRAMQLDPLTALRED